MKKSLLVLPAILLSASLFAGCNQVPTNESAVSSEASETFVSLEASEPSETEETSQASEPAETEPVSYSDDIYIELIPEGSRVISVKLTNETGKDIENVNITPDADIDTGKADIEIVFADGDTSLLMGIRLSDIEQAQILWDDSGKSAYITYTSLKSGEEIDTLTMSPDQTYVEETTAQTTRHQNNADSGCIGDGGLTY